MGRIRHADRTAGAVIGDRTLVHRRVTRTNAAHHQFFRNLLELYDRLLVLNPSPIVGLNRAVALAMVEGPEAGVMALRDIEDHAALQDYYLLPATFGDFFARMKDWDSAARYLTLAMQLPCSEPDKRFLEKQLAACRKPNNGTVATSP